MSSADSSIAADLTLAPSLRGLQWAFWLHVIPACLLPFATHQKWYALPLLALIFASWVYVRRHKALGFGPDAIRRVLARTDGSWWIEAARDGGRSAQLLPDTVVTSALLVLRFRSDDGRSHTRLVLDGDADEAALRRLRARLLDRREAAKSATDT